MAKSQLKAWPSYDKYFGAACLRSRYSVVYRVKYAKAALNTGLHCATVKVEHSLEESQERSYS